MAGADDALFATSAFWSCLKDDEAGRGGVGQGGERLAKRPEGEQDRQLCSLVTEVVANASKLGGAEGVLE